MRKRECTGTLIVAALLLLHFSAAAQTLTETGHNQIKNEINTAFENNLVAGQIFDINTIIKSVNDTLKAGFIDQGRYYASFSDLMVVFRERTQGIDSQELKVVNKKITVLGEHSALVTCSGTYIVSLLDGRNFSGEFAWTLVYARVDGNWKVIHTHM